MISKQFIYNILAVFLSGLILLLFMQYNYSSIFDDLINENKQLLYELKVNNQLRELEKDVITLESRIRGSVATDNISFLNGLDKQITNSKSRMNALLNTKSDDSTTININKLYTLADEKLALRRRIIDSFRLRGTLLPASFDSILENRMESSSSNAVNMLFLRVYDARKLSLNELNNSINASSKKAHTSGVIMIVLILLSEGLLFLFIVNRIRSQNRLILQLNASEKKLKAVSKIKENFLANISHEIRTPMNAILGFANLLQKKNKQPELGEFVEAIRLSGENLLTIINDILDLSKIEAEVLKLESAPFSIREVIHSIEMLFGEKIREKSLRLSVSLDNSIPDILIGDAARLNQILINLVGNAIKFTETGTITIEVKKDTASENKLTLAFSITDTGIGIAQEKTPYIFHRFSQAENSIIRTYGGTGLGLAIVKELLILQDGKIDVSSKLGAGTTFRFTIPYKIADNQSPIRQLFIQPATDLHTLNILIAEDNKMNQNLLTHLFKEWHVSFTIVNNGAEILSTLQAGKYDLILMDLQMPEMDGYTATSEIRKKMDIPIIAMTAHAFATEREKCLSHGMNDYISKPINEHELLKIISKFTNKDQVQNFVKEKEMNKTPVHYKVIDLQYMYDISKGNKEYEKTTTEQFLEAIPEDIALLESAFSNADTDTIRKTAHNMKTNVSVMGLLDKLQPTLDALEDNAFDEIKFSEHIQCVKTICQNAIPEAQHFLSTL